MSDETDLSETVQVLAIGLSDAHFPVRDNAARALAKLGVVAEPAMPALVAQLEDEDRYVRFHAAVALKADSNAGGTRRSFQSPIYFAVVYDNNTRNPLLENLHYSKRARYETSKRNGRVLDSLSILAETFTWYLP